MADDNEVSLSKYNNYRQSVDINTFMSCLFKLLENIEKLSYRNSFNGFQEIEDHKDFI